MTPFFNIWDQTTQNRHIKKVIGTNITALYSALCITYFFTQILVLISALDANRSAGSSLEAMLNKAHVSTSSDFAYLDSDVHLRICHGGITKSTSVEQCPVIFPVDDKLIPVAASAANFVLASQYVKREDDITLVPVFNDANLTAFMVLDSTRPGEVISLPPVCLQALDWPYQHLIQNRRVDVTVACFQVLLMIISVVALFNQSFSSIIAAFIMHILGLVLSSSQIADLVAFRSDYVRLITTSPTGACEGYDLLGTFFNTRLTYAIAMTVVNVIALAVSGYLSWRLLMPYGLEMLDQSGVSKKVRVAWITAQALFATTQLSAFFFIASVGIWIDEITKHIMGARPALLPMCLTFYIIAVLLVVPWLSLAHFAIRRESARFMLAFFVLACVYLAGSGVMFVSTTFRQTFVSWPFFAAMFILSHIFLVATVVLAIICRLNFGTEVMEYLRANKGEDASRTYTDEKGNLKRLTLADRGHFVVPLPRQSRLESLPKRWASLSSINSSKSSRSTTSESPSPIIAAQPGAIRIASPMPTVTSSTLSPANSVSSKGKAAWKYGEKPFWGRTNKRHESAMSFGHMDPSRLTISSAMPPHRAQSSAADTLSPPAPSQAPRTDSVGSIYSNEPKKMCLFLVTDL